MTAFRATVLYQGLPAGQADWDGRRIRWTGAAEHQEDVLRAVGLCRLLRSSRHRERLQSLHRGYRELLILADSDSREKQELQQLQQLHVVAEAMVRASWELLRILGDWMEPRPRLELQSLEDLGALAACILVGDRQLQHIVEQLEPAGASGEQLPLLAGQFLLQFRQLCQGMEITSVTPESLSHHA